MRRVIPLLLLALPALADEGPSLPDNPEVAKAREAYNAEQYHLAARRFLGAAQAWPREVAIYRALARARVYAGDHAGAAQAYRVYLAAAPEAADREKIEAEKELAEKKAGDPVPAIPGARAVEAASVRARAGRFGGEDGALGALATAVEAGFIGPALADARDQVGDALQKQSEDAVLRWWRAEARVEKQTLARLRDGWRALQEVEGLRTLPKVAGAIDGLALLAEGNVVGALDVLGEIAPGDPRLRFAHAIALARAGRHAEAAQVLEVLARTEDDPRVAALHGLVLNAQGQREEGAALMFEALR